MAGECSMAIGKRGHVACVGGLGCRIAWQWSQVGDNDHDWHVSYSPKFRSVGEGS